MITIQTPDDDDMIGTSFGPYMVEAIQHSTPQITTFRGQHRHSRQAVQIRVLAEPVPPGLRDTFLIEKEKLREFDHPYILPLLAFGEEHGRLFAISPLIDGVDLRARLGDGLLPYDDVMRLIKEVASALDYAHARGVLHSGLCPESILIDTFGNLYLVDFGLPLPPPGYYASPEMWRGDDLDSYSDIYALGVVLYEMITGQVPFHSSDLDELKRQHLFAVPPLPVRPDEPAGFVNEEPVFRALTKKPSRRFPNAAGLAAAFAKTLAGRITRDILKPLPRIVEQERVSELIPRWLPTGTLTAMTGSSDSARILEFGDAAISGCGFLPGGADVIFSTEDGRVFRWDAGAESPDELGADESPILSLSISRDGEFLLTTHADGSARIRAKSGIVLHNLTGHEGSATCGDFGGRGLLVATGGADGILRIQEVRTGDMRHEIEAHHGGVTCCSLSDNSQLLLSGGADGELHLWNTQSGERVQTFSGHEGAVTACHIKGELAFSGGADGELRVWDILMEDHPLVIQGHSGAVTAVHVQEVGARVQGVSSSEDGTIGVWDLRSTENLFRLEPHSGPLRCCAVSGRRILSGSESGSLHIRHLPRPVEVVTGHSRRTVDAAVSEQVVFSVSVDGVIRQTDAERGTILNETTLSIAPRCLALTDDYVFIGTLDGLLKCYDRTSFRLRWEASAHESELRFVAAVDEQRIVSGGADGVLALWNTVNGARLSAVALKTGGLRCGVPVNGLVVVGNQEGGVAVWDVVTGAQRHLYGEFMTSVTACAAQQNHLIAGFADGAIFRWSLASEEPEMGFRAHGADITALAAHPDQRTLLTADSAGEVTIWDVESGFMLDEWQPPAPITAACWAGPHHLILTDEAGGVSALAWTPANM